MSFTQKLINKLKKLLGMETPATVVTVSPLVTVEEVVVPVRAPAQPKVAPKITPANHQRAKRKRRPKPKGDQPKVPPQSPKPVKGDKAK